MVDVGDDAEIAEALERNSGDALLQVGRLLLGGGRGGAIASAERRDRHARDRRDAPQRNTPQCARAGEGDGGSVVTTRTRRRRRNNAAARRSWRSVRLAACSKRPQQALSHRGQRLRRPTHANDRLEAQGQGKFYEASNMVHGVAHCWCQCGIVVALNIERCRVSM